MAEHNAITLVAQLRLEESFGKRGALAHRPCALSKDAYFPGRARAPPHPARYPLATLSPGGERAFNSAQVHSLVIASSKFNTVLAVSVYAAKVAVSIPAGFLRSPCVTSFWAAAL